jgi:anti-sigma factor RsiW
MTPLDCQAVVRRLWDYLDGALDATDAAGIDTHLGHCERCPPHFAFERAFLRAVRAARAEHGELAALRGRVLASLESEGFVGGREQ